MKKNVYLSRADVISSYFSSMNKNNISSKFIKKGSKSQKKEIKLDDYNPTYSSIKSNDKKPSPSYTETVKETIKKRQNSKSIFFNIQSKIKNEKKPSTTANNQIFVLRMQIEKLKKENTLLRKENDYYKSIINTRSASSNKTINNFNRNIFLLSPKTDIEKNIFSVKTMDMHTRNRILLHKGRQSINTTFSHSKLSISKNESNIDYNYSTIRTNPSVDHYYSNSENMLRIDNYLSDKDFNTINTFNQNYKNAKNRFNNYNNLHSVYERTKKIFELYRTLLCKKLLNNIN